MGWFRTGNKKRRTRQEPSLDGRRDDGELDLRLTGEDRTVPQPRRAPGADSKRRETAKTAPREPGARRERSRPRKARRSVFGTLAYWSVVLGLWCFIAVGGLVAWHATQLPPIETLAVPKRPPNIAIIALDGTPLANRGDTGGRAVTLQELPAYLPAAFVAIEDRRFRSHFGIDPIGIARALVRNVSQGGVAQGGSTLTQQLAKNLFLTQERTASRKIQEAILALWLEQNYSKDQILELYLNRVYFGSGAYGVEAAAQRYFNKSARGVTLAEAAMLAGIVQAPSRLSPNRNPDGARARAAMVLSAMASEGLVSDGMVKTALMSPAEAMRQAGAGSVNYAADYVMDVLDDVVGAIETDIIVTTTIDAAAQASAETALVSELDAKGAKMGVTQGALVALAPDGGVRALVGGRSYSESQFNRASAAKRQPGSAFKPFVYLAALERGLTPETVREDSAVNLRGWRPENFNREFRGPVTLREALATSLNTVAVKLGMEVGPRTVVRTAQRVGIVSPLQANASIALGTSEVTPVELVAAYAAFANGGIGVTPHVITKVATVDGKVLFLRKPVNLGRVIEPDVAAAMNSMLRETLVTGTARRAELKGWEAAGKTGTSQDFRDAWFLGYTSQLVTGVWLGNDDSSPTKKVSGSGLPAEIWNRFMTAALRDLTPTPLFGGPYRSRPTREIDQGTPMASVPSSRAGGPVAHSNDAWVPPDPRERGLLERLFGG